MNDASELIVGIDFGSSGLTGGVARRNAAGKTELLALKQLPGNVGVRRGAVHNIEVVSGHVKTLLRQLTTSLTIEGQINKVNVGVNGYTIRTIDAKSALPLSGDECLNDNHLDELSDEAQGNTPEELYSIECHPQEFLLDGKPDTNPVGTMPKYIEARYKIVVCQPFLYRNLSACFDTLKMDFDTILGPVASAEAVLKSEDKARGVVVVDFGAQTTSVTVYKASIVRYVAVLPFGGDNITKDLQYLNIETDEAEKLKIESGSALHYTDKIIEEETDPEGDKVSKFDKEANEIMVARTEEIVDNIYAHIQYSGIETQKLTEGIVMTGGASKLADLSELIAKKTGMAVRSGNPAQAFDVIPEGIEIGPEDALCIGLLLMGKDHCVTEVQKVAESSVTAPTVTPTVKEPALEGFETGKKQPTERTKGQSRTREKNKEGGLMGGIWKKLFDDEDI